MRIDFIFDTICPWCFIGKRRLDRALRLRPGLRPELHWRPFLLNPDLPPEGMERRLYLERRFGSAYRVQRIYGAAALAGVQEDIAFDFEAIHRTPSSINSHRLIQWATASGRQAEVVDAVFSGYFIRGLNIGDIGVLAELAESCGLSGDEAARYLSSPTGVAAIEAENLRVHRLGVSGVPCLILAESYALAGAQDPDILARLIDVARETELVPESR